MATTALILKIIGAITFISSILYTITANSTQKKRILIGLIALVIACLLLNEATHIEDRIRAGYYY